MVLSSADIIFQNHFFAVVDFFYFFFCNLSRVSSSLDPECPLGLIWVLIVCKGYQQTTLVSKEFRTTSQAN